MPYRNVMSTIVRSMPAKFPSKCVACNCPVPAGEMIQFTVHPSGQKEVRHNTVQQCQTALADRAARQAAAPKILNNDFAKLVDFLRQAQLRGLKYPKVRFLGPDGKTEIRISLTTRGQAPGSLALVVGGNYYGAVRPDGTLTGALSTDRAMQQRLVHIAVDPAAAAKEYAALMCNCSFCSKPLTDAGSVEVGYGPICAKHYGLPHTALGTSVIGKVPEVK